MWLKKTISGIRGIVGDDLEIKDVIEFCCNFAGLTDGECVTGMDTRPSSKAVVHAVHAGLMAKGVNVHGLGMVPTPVVFREARKTGAGVMITSSHNPLEWNGLKFILNGRGINESELPRIIEPTQSSIDSTVNLGTEDMHASSSYVEEAAKVIGDIQGEPHVMVDVGGGAAVHVAPQLYEKIGCKVDVINTEINSRSPDPTTDSLTGLVESSSGHDIGLAFDLDGDRLVIVMDGVKQAPDVTLGLGIAGALDKGYRNFVLSVDTSLGVERLIASYGGTSIRAKVGEANVVDEMIKRGAQAGGEGSSGGFILPEFNYCRDGMLAGGMIAGMLQSDQKRHLDEVFEILDRHHIIRTKIQTDADDNTMEKASAWLEAECSEVQNLDGLKGIIDEESWILLRRSNTENAIRISAESRDESTCNSLVEGISNAIR